MSQMLQVLFVGNSYMTRNEMPKMLMNLAAKSDSETGIQAEVIAFGGASLAAHWNRGEVQKRLNERSWDAVVLQDQSTRPINALSSMQEHVRRFVAAVRISGAEPYLYITWARKNSPESQECITKTYSELAAETGAKTVPVGVVWEHARNLRSDLELFDPDESHPSVVGSYLSACTHLVSLLGVMPNESNETDLELNATDRGFIHQLCWNVARNDITFR